MLSDYINIFVDTDNQRIIIALKDVNDEPPYFINRPLPMQAVVQLNAPPNTPVFTLQARDPDTEANIHYFIVRDRSMDSSLFLVKIIVRNQNVLFVTVCVVFLKTALELLHNLSHSSWRAVRGRWTIWRGSHQGYRPISAWYGVRAVCESRRSKWTHRWPPISVNPGRKVVHCWRQKSATILHADVRSRNTWEPAQRFGVRIFDFKP